ncbi:MAG TPA: ABC transporter substrate-binding protein [Granulicella sp.]|jgi:iron complex transport system substrate-binding protein|nr:ABC transporter substrate-binding protein [Granulicella sp.]
MRIASLQPSITLILKSLNRLDALCACTRYCLEAVPELADRNLPILQDSWTANTEEILVTAPDLVLASVPYRLESLAAILKSGLPILTLAPHTLKDIYTDTRLIAAVVDARAEGEALIERMEQAIEQIRATLAAQSEAVARGSGIVQQGTESPARPLVYCEEWGKPLIHSQAWVAELVEAAGGRFLGEPGAHTTPEAVAAANPDVLLFAWCGAGDRVPLAKVVDQRVWQQLPAVVARRVHCIPDQYLNTPATTLLDGLNAIAGALHPTLFAAHPEVRTLA